MAASRPAKAGKRSEKLQESVRDAHVAVGVETRGKPIQRFTCRELPVGKLELFDIWIDPIAIYRRTEDIDKDANDDFLLATQVEGTVVVPVSIAWLSHPALNRWPMMKRGCCSSTRSIAAIASPRNASAHSWARSSPSIASRWL